MNLVLHWTTRSNGIYYLKIYTKKPPQDAAAFLNLFQPLARCAVAGFEVDAFGNGEASASDLFDFLVTQ